jgi:hypothetical protein
LPKERREVIKEVSMKKVLILIAILLMLFFILSGFSSGKESISRKEVIKDDLTVWPEFR